MMASLNRVWDHPILPLLILLIANAVFYISVASAIA
jgi:hypothetical protein